MNELMSKYYNLPEWVRWVIFLPISLIVSIVLGLIISIIMLTPGYNFDLLRALLSAVNVGQIVYSVAVSSIFLFMVFLTIPRWHWGAVIFFVAMRSLVLIFLLLMLVMTPYLVSIGCFDNSSYKDIYNWKYYSDIIVELCVLVTSILIVLETKKYKYDDLYMPSNHKVIESDAEIKEIKTDIKKEKAEGLTEKDKEDAKKRSEETHATIERVKQLAKDAGKRIKVLAIDDQPGVLSSIKEILNIADVEVITALDGEPGLKLLTSDFDMVFTGMKQPRMNGVEILKAVKERFPFMPVAIITAYASEEISAKSMKYGAYEYLRKPFLMGEIYDLVEKGFKLRHTGKSK